VAPEAEGTGHEGFVVEAGIARHFLTQEWGTVVGFVGSGEFYLCHDEAVVVAMKFIDLDGVASVGYKPAGFVDASWAAEFHEFVGVVQRDFGLEFIA